MSGTAAEVAASAERTLTSTTSSKISSVNWSIGTRLTSAPALLTSRSIRPKRFAVSATALRIASDECASARTVNASPPAARTSAATCSAASPLAK